MPRDRRFVIGLLASVLMISSAAAQEMGVRWQYDIETAKATARQTGRLVLVHVWTENCAPCMALESNVFNQPGVAQALEAKFVPVKLNANEFPATAQGFGVTRVPTDVVLTSDGQVLGMMISPATPMSYIAEMTRVANRFASRPGQAYQTVAATATQQKILNPAYSNLQVGAAAVPVVALQQAAPAQPTAPSTPFAAAVAQANERFALAGMPPAGMSAGANGAASVPFIPQPPAGQSPNATVIANQHYSAANRARPNPATTSPAYGAVNQTAPPAVNPPATVINDYATARPNVSAQPNRQTLSGSLTPANSTAPTVVESTAPTATAATPAAPDVTKLPAGAPPLGFDGYCPVSMRSSWKWVPGDPRFGAIHRERTYWFASPREQQQFLANPDFYGPALGGIDPVMAIDHRQSVAGMRDHALDYDNQFYLFSSEATLQQFTANPERYARGVRQAMGLPPGQQVR